MKNIIGRITFILLMTALLIVSTYQIIPNEISITIGDKELEYVIAKNKWNGAIYDREDTFKTIFKKGSVDEIPYINIGKTIVITFLNYPPSQVTISDILINKYGIRYILIR